MGQVVWQAGREGVCRAAGVVECGDVPNSLPRSPHPVPAVGHTHTLLGALGTPHHHWPQERERSSVQALTGGQEKGHRKAVF